MKTTHVRRGRAHGHAKRLSDIDDYLMALRRITPEGCWVMEGRSPSSSLRFSGYVARPYRWAALVASDFNVWNTAGWQINHTCDNPQCYNPDHLYIGTQQDNMKDMMQRGRFVHGPKPRGEDHHQAKLTDATVRLIRQRKRAGETYKAIAKDLKVSKETVGRVWRGNSWSHVQ